MQLNQFINKTMKMTSYYQPLIIMSCLGNHGKASLEQIADNAIMLGLAKTRGEVIPKLKIHPKTVLASHNVAKLENNEYSLLIETTLDQAIECVSLCVFKLNSYKKQKGL